MTNVERTIRRVWISPPNSPTYNAKSNIQKLLFIVLLRSPLSLLLIGFFVGFLLSSFWTMTISLTQVPLIHSTASMIIQTVSTNKDEQRKLTPTDNAKESKMHTVDNGWNEIHVYVGSGTNTSNKINHMIEASMIPNDYFYTTKWFSQARQDEIVYYLLRNKTDGYFLDLAANDAIRISNTFALEYYHNWTGIVIEPNPIYWSSLSYRNCTVIAAVIGQQTNQEMKFKFPEHSKPSPQGGLVGPAFDNHDESDKNNNNKDEDTMRYTISLKDIFLRFHVPKIIDYFSLDIEGAETFVMESFPFDLYQFNVLSVERATDRLRMLLQQNGYQQLKQLKRWGETLWIHTSILHNTNMIDLSALNVDSENYKYREKVSSSRP